MIKTEIIDNKYIFTYSDTNYKIKQIPTGIILDYAIDSVDSRKEYIETDEQIETVEDYEE